MSEEAREADATPVVVARIDPVAVVRLNRPAQRNPLSSPTLGALEEIFYSLSADRNVRSIIFTGSEDVFASGADIRELAALTPEAAREFSARGQRLFQSIADSRQLTIAAVDGFCMGGGLDFALACHLRCASPRSAFAHPGARLGIITGWGGTQRLPRVVGTALAAEMFLTGRRLSGAEGYEAGLVDYLSERPLERARAVALGVVV